MDIYVGAFNIYVFRCYNGASLWYKGLLVAQWVKGKLVVKNEILWDEWQP